MTPAVKTIAVSFEDSSAIPDLIIPITCHLTTEEFIALLRSRQPQILNHAAENADISEIDAGRLRISSMATQAPVTQFKIDGPSDAIVDAVDVEEARFLGKYYCAQIQMNGNIDEMVRIEDIQALCDVMTAIVINDVTPSNDEHYQALFSMRGYWYIDRRDAEGGETILGRDAALTEEKARAVEDVLNRANLMGKKELELTLETIKIFV